MEKKYKVVISGCGDMVMGEWVPYLLQRDDCQIVGLEDIADSQMEKMEEKFHLNVPHFHSVEQAIKETGANLMCNGTTPDAHADVCIEAMENGCDVFSEKPMVDTVENIRRVCEAAEHTKRHYSIMQNRRYLKPMQDIRSFLHTGKVGKPEFLSADFFIGAHFNGFRLTMDHPLLMDMAVHTFDQARYLMDADAVSVYCHEFNTSDSYFEKNASAICIFEMSNGGVFSYRASWNATGFNTPWECNWRIQCAEGTILWEDGQWPKAQTEIEPEEWQLLHEAQDIEIPSLYQGRTEHFGCLDEMFDALGQHKMSITDYRDNMQTIRMAFAAVKSAETGEKIYLKDL